MAETFVGRAKAAQPALIGGTAGLAWAPGGTPRVVFGSTIRDGRVVAIELLADAERIGRLDLELLAGRAAVAGTRGCSAPGLPPVPTVPGRAPDTPRTGEVTAGGSRPAGAPTGRAGPATPYDTDTAPPPHHARITPRRPAGPKNRYRRVNGEPSAIPGKRVAV
ncbi:hypothetical protein ACIGW8_12575 [Streptomyces sioyaensis]|uniref:hypothetical protein n=1 Tax=Streptomyces sioyaensis TaxID=67364 RepID=UPI0037D70ADC